MADCSSSDSPCPGGDCCAPTTSASTAEITHVIFDLDGLLMDTESIYSATTQKIVGRYGKTFDWSVKSRMMGRKPIEAAKVLVDTLGIPMTADEFNTELYSIVEKLFPDAELMPGGAELIRHFHSLGVPLALATGSTGRTYAIKISKHEDLFSCFHHAVCSDDPEVKHGKPNPDIYNVAVSRFETPPKSNANVLVFEDAPNGVLAAKAAGMKCVMVPDERVEPERRKPADRVLTSLLDLDLSEWGFPPVTESTK